MFAVSSRGSESQMALEMSESSISAGKLPDLVLTVRPLITPPGPLEFQFFLWKRERISFPTASSWRAFSASSISWSLFRPLS